MANTAALEVMRQHVLQLFRDAFNPACPCVSPEEFERELNAYGALLEESATYRALQRIVRR